MHPEFVFTTAQTPKHLKQVLQLRKEIFVDEQEIPIELEMDGQDDKSIHAIALKDDMVVATGRLTLEGKEGVISRIAVSSEFRRSGLGRSIMQYLEEQARQLQLHELTLKPHNYLQPFYQSLGYSLLGDYHDKVGKHELITMHKILTSS